MSQSALRMHGRALLSHCSVLGDSRSEYLFWYMLTQALHVKLVFALRLLDPSTLAQTPGAPESPRDCQARMNLVYSQRQMSPLVTAGRPPDLVELW